ncbi:MAG: SIS domain-containing protein [Paracoccaceae bacterium]
MRKEVLEIPDAVERLLSLGENDIRNAARAARDHNPAFLLSVARGSSDHACTYLKYVSELILRRPMASVGPSIKSIYDVDVQCDGAVSFSVSQSGMSPDIVRATKAISAAGGLSIALTNTPESDLATVASATLPLHAGPELSVAATKTFVTSLVAGLWLIAEIKKDETLIKAIQALPEYLSGATTCDWSEAAASIGDGSLFTIGRGPSWAISNEAALKFKETCLIHAESYSSAEVFHGPVSIVEQGFPIIGFAANDAAESSLAETADALTDKGANVFAVTSKVKKATALSHVRTDHWLTDPISAIVTFYSMVEQIALSRGIDPDKPRHLNKVTQTV